MNSGATKPRILFVEDDMILSMLYTTRLKAEGFTVVESFDGEAALMAYREFHPDLVVCDLMLPHISGFEVIEQIRANPESGRIKIVVLSALSHDSDIEKAKELGADDYIVKSLLTMNEIVERLRHHLGLPPGDSATK